MKFRIEMGLRLDFNCEESKEGKRTNTAHQYSMSQLDQWNLFQIEPKTIWLKLYLALSKWVHVLSNTFRLEKRLVCSVSYRIWCTFIKWNECDGDSSLLKLKSISIGNFVSNHRNAWHTSKSENWSGKSHVKEGQMDVPLRRLFVVCYPLSHFSKINCTFRVI